MMDTVKDLKARADKAWTCRQIYDGMLRDVYDYVLPYRDTSGLQSNGRTEGAKRTDKLFDGTAPKAAFRFAGRMQTELTPIFQDFFTLEAGPLVPDNDEKTALSAELQRVGKIVSGVLAGGTFHTRSHEMYTDLFAGTGAMFMPKGNERTIIRFASVPMAELALEAGPYGDIWHIYWRKTYKMRDLKTLWPKGAFSEKLLKKMADDGDAETVVCQYTRFEEATEKPAEDKWKLLVWSDKCEDGDQPIWMEEFRTCPWLTPRFFVVPGEAYGRGPAMLAMPFIKTTNKVQELALKAAAFSVFGIWTRRNDGVFNPDTARLEPLAMWPVASNGGPLGPTISRLPVPDNFDVSSFVLENERMQMKAALFDDTLPPDTAAVKSATEIAERMRTLSQDFAGVYGRLTLEVVVPLVQRVIDVLEQMGKLEGKIKIDQLLTQVRVVAPIAAGQQASKVKQAVDALQMTAMLGGPQATMLAYKVEELYPQLGRWLGVDEKYIRSQAQQKQLMATIEEAKTEQQNAELAAKAPPEPPGAQYTNGGAI